MKPWSEFIAGQKIGTLQLENSLCALQNMSLLYVGGDDATDFLQNQLSNDINAIDENLLQISSFSNAKGRMLGIFRVIKIEGGYLLLMPSSILQSMHSTLQKFIIRSKVILADITDTFACFSLVTDQQPIITDDLLPSQVNQVNQSDSLISIRLQNVDDQFRYLLMSNDVAEAIKVWQSFSALLTINKADNWRLQEILSAVPVVYPETEGAFVLQMSNLQLIDGVSFKKGCFPGQEVVARMQYLGKLKRRMYLAEIDTTTCPDPGDELCSKDLGKADGSGKVVDAIQISADKAIMLFIAQIAKAEDNKLMLLDQPDATISLRQLPYPVTQ